MAEPVLLIAWIDFLDPWSYVTTKRLEQLAPQYGDRIQLEWRAFMRYPEKREWSSEDYRVETTAWLEPASAEPELTFSLWSSGAAPPTHSAPALVAALVAGDENGTLAPAYWRLLFVAHFERNLTISDPVVLIELAREVGYDEMAFAMRLRGSYADYVKRVVEDHNDALRRGITDVPAVIVANEYLVKGAGTLDQYRELLEGLLPTEEPQP
jgi:predicted DsbA family dithiol-disulfide isomerase